MKLANNVEALDPNLMIPARLDRLPFSAFHVRTLVVVGLAHLFDAFDSLTIAFVLPALIGAWHIHALQIGLLLAVGYCGQLIGAVGMSGLAERFGRRPALMGALFIVSILSLGCAAAPSYLVLLVLRFVQGVGLGGEVPIAASYLNELCPTRLRGRIIFILQALFAGGALVTAFIATQIIPHYGWRVMFVIGGLPLLLAICLRWLVPESPRWLATKGRTAQADALVTRIEAKIEASGRTLPMVEVSLVPQIKTQAAGLRDLLGKGYRSRSLSVWLIAFCLSVTGYGLLTWMPTLYVSVYKLPLKLSLAYALAPNAAGIAGALFGAWAVERIGRKPCFLMGFLGGAAPLLVLVFTRLPAHDVMLLSAVSMFFLTLLLSGIYVYAPEIYPTRMRALGTGVATAWMRVASIVGPLIVGLLLSDIGLPGVFGFFAGASLVGAATVAAFFVETRGRRLEELAA